MFCVIITVITTSIRFSIAYYFTCWFSFLIIKKLITTSILFIIVRYLLETWERYKIQHFSFVCRRSISWILGINYGSSLSYWSWTDMVLVLNCTLFSWECTTFFQNVPFFDSYFRIEKSDGALMSNWFSTFSRICIQF